jgi:hypothetical protein
MTVHKDETAEPGIKAANQAGSAERAYTLSCQVRWCLTNDLNAYKKDKDSADYAQVEKKDQDNDEQGSKENGKSQDPETCPKCKVAKGHDPSCANRYRNCWMLGMRKGGVSRE